MINTDEHTILLIYFHRKNERERNTTFLKTFFMFQVIKTQNATNAHNAKSKKKNGSYTQIDVE